MTAITDILVNSNLLELQLSNTNQKSQISSSSVSFQDYLTSFKPEENKVVQKSDNYNKNENYKTEDVNSTRESEYKESDEKVETSSASVPNSNDSDNKLEDINQFAEKSDDSVKNDFVSEKINEKNKNLTSIDESQEKNVKTNEKSVDLQTILEGKVAKNSNENNEKSEKLTENKKSLKNDFSRLDELLAEKENSVEELIDSEKNLAELQSAAGGNELLKSTLQELAENKNSKGTETEIDTVENNLIASKLDADVKDFSKELNLENTNPRISKLDKDGKITVEDFRTEIPVEKKELDSDKTELKTQIKYDGENSATITMEMAQNADVDVRSLNSQTAASDGSNFQAMLNNTIQNNASEFVKAGNIVLKDNDKGTINLVLRPDELGNVKIHLSMDGKTVHGHITVNSKEALQVFKDNAETLREAFIKNGFDAANFDVAYNNNSSGQNQEFNQQFTDSQFVAKKAYGDSSVAEGISDGINFEENDDFSKYSVNIVA